MVGGGQTGLTWEARTGEAVPLRLTRGDRISRKRESRGRRIFYRLHSFIRVSINGPQALLTRIEEQYPD